MAVADMSFHATKFSVNERILVGILAGLTVVIIIAMSICCQFQIISFVTAAVISLNMSACIWMVGFCIRYFLNFLVLKNLPRLKVIENVFLKKPSSTHSSYWEHSINFESQLLQPFIVSKLDNYKNFRQPNKPTFMMADALEKLLESFFEKDIREAREYISSLKPEQDLFFEECCNLFYPNRMSKLVVPFLRCILQLFQNYSLIDGCYFFLLKPEASFKMSLFLKNSHEKMELFKDREISFIDLLQMINVYLQGCLMTSEVLLSNFSDCLLKVCPHLDKKSITAYMESGNIVGLVLSLQKELHKLGIVKLETLGAQYLVPTKSCELKFLNSQDYISEDIHKQQQFLNFKKCLVPKLLHLPKPGVLFKARLLQKWSLISEIRDIYKANQKLIGNNPFLVLEILYKSRELQVFIKTVLNTFFVPVLELEEILLPLILGGSCFGLLTNSEIAKFLQNTNAMTVEDFRKAIEQKTILKKLFPHIFSD